VKDSSKNTPWKDLRSDKGKDDYYRPGEWIGDEFEVSGTAGIIQSNRQGT
jgi:hypothetical protein